VVKTVGVGIRRMCVRVKSRGRDSCPLCRQMCVDCTDTCALSRSQVGDEVGVLVI
jgi:hypothetical protein